MYIETVYTSKSNYYDGEQLSIELEVTVPPTAGQEPMNISFTPKRQVNY